MSEEPRDFDARVLRVISRAGRFVLWPGLVAVALLLVVAVGYSIVQDSVNAQLGFDYATPEVSFAYEPFLITRVDPERAMARAGMQVDDRVLLDDVSKLYALLISRQGDSASIPIERDGRARTMIVRVPPLRLPLSPGLRRLLYGRYGA